MRVRVIVAYNLYVYIGYITVKVRARGCVCIQRVSRRFDKRRISFLKSGHRLFSIRFCSSSPLPTYARFVNPFVFLAYRRNVRRNNTRTRLFPIGSIFGSRNRTTVFVHREGALCTRPAYDNYVYISDGRVFCVPPLSFIVSWTEWGGEGAAQDAFRRRVCARAYKRVF